MIRVMRLWKDGTVTNVGVFASLFWALRSFDSTYGKRLWVEDEKKPATLRGHS